MYQPYVLFSLHIDKSQEELFKKVHLLKILDEQGISKGVA